MEGAKEGAFFARKTGELKEGFAGQGIPVQVLF
jgi:hypothetical protein